MDITPLVAAAIGGAIALTSQIAAARSGLRIAQTQIDYDRWEAWRRDGADVWADLLGVVRSLDVGFDELAQLSDSELEALRDRVRGVIRSLDRLSALSLDRQVGDWSQQMARLLEGLAVLTPAHHGCDDEEKANNYQGHRHVLHARFDWNDGDRSTQLDRFRDAISRSTDPPLRKKSRRRSVRHRPRSRRSRW